jgi:hypothetical protein
VGPCEEGVLLAGGHAAGAWAQVPPVAAGWLIGGAGKRKQNQISLFIFQLI